MRIAVRACDFIIVGGGGWWDSNYRINLLNCIHNEPDFLSNQFKIKNKRWIPHARMGRMLRDPRSLACSIGVDRHALLIC